MERYRQRSSWYRTLRPTYGVDYWVNSRTLEVHSSDCPHLPRVNKVRLGHFSSLRMATLWATATLRARRYRIGADPCFFCGLREDRRKS